MDSTKHLLSNLWRWKCGLPELKKPVDFPTLIEIEKSQWSERFEWLRKNRMILGFFRYGKILNNTKKYDNIGSTIIRLQEYQKTGNSENLIDAANLCMVEFMQKNHPNFHFESVDDGLHTKQIK